MTRETMWRLVAVVGFGVAAWAALWPTSTEVLGTRVGCGAPILHVLVGDHVDEDPVSTSETAAAAEAMCDQLVSERVWIAIATGVFGAIGATRLVLDAPPPQYGQPPEEDLDD